MIKLNCMFDSKGYKSKPQGAEMAQINNRIIRQQHEQLTVGEFARRLGQGRAYISGHLIDRNGGRKAHNFHNINSFSIDIDNHYRDKNNKDIYTYHSEADVIGAVKNLIGAEPSIIYTTYSKENPNGSGRFRLIYLIEDCISTDELRAVLEHIADKCGDMVDQACKDTGRIYQGTCHSVKECEGVPLSIKKIKELIEITETERAQMIQKAVKNTEYSGDYEDSEVIEALKSIDIGRYLNSRGYNVKLSGNGYKCACPIHHGKNDNFSINNVNGVWLYRCFSKCGGAGGSIIDLHMQLENVDTATAIEELCDLYNIKQVSHKTVKPVEATSRYNIDKYISNDTEALNGLIDVIKEHRRTLLTGSMGSGKTYFVINDLYRYAKSQSKKLVIIIPGVKQLKNIKNSYDIDIVCDGADYNNADIVATTPESLPKVVGKLSPDSFVLVVDESHERYTGYSYRNGYKDRNIDKAEQVAHRILHITATPKLLAYEEFDSIVEIITNERIDASITAVRVGKGRTLDSMHTMSNDLIEKGYKVVLFNNNKADNEEIAKLIERVEISTERKARPGQIHLVDEEIFDTVTTEKIIVGAETVYSGKSVESVENGRVEHDFTATTDTIKAGIDLETDDDTYLIINPDLLEIDGLIQLIGRFRNGVKVFLILEDTDNPNSLFSFADRYNSSIRRAEGVAKLLNEESAEVDIELDGGIADQAGLYKENDKWKVDRVKHLARIDKAYSRALYDNVEILKETLELQQAFSLSGFTVIRYVDEDTQISDQRKATAKEKRDRIKELSEEIMQLDEHIVDEAMRGNYYELANDNQMISKIEEYKGLAKGHIEKIQLIEEKLFKDEDCSRGKALKHFYSKPFTHIQKEIGAEEAKAINRLIKEHGLETYIDKHINEYRTAKEVVQAKIRYELREIEKARGRITERVLYELTEKLVAGKYINNKHTKVLADPKADKKAQKKALDSVGQTVKDLLKNIYSFKDRNAISSIKE